MNSVNRSIGRPIVCAMLLVLAALWLSLPAAHAAGGDPNEIPLNDAVVAKFLKAQQNVNALLAAHPQLRAKAESVGDAKTVEEAVADLDAIPGMNAAISGAGMSTRDYFLSLATVTGAVLAAGFVQQEHSLDKMKPGLEKDNIEYLLSHKNQMAQLVQLMKASNGGEGPPDQ